MKVEATALIRIAEYVGMQVMTDGETVCVQGNPEIRQILVPVMKPHKQALIRVLLLQGKIETPSRGP
jgi:hypothetical protein